MSFLDESDDSPGRSAPRRPARGRATDRQTLLVRRAGAGAIGFLVLLLLVLGVRGCVSSRKEQAFKDYVRDASSLQDQSQRQSDAFFRALQEARGQTPVDLENSVNSASVQAEQLVDQAKRLDTPDQLKGTHGYLVEALELRRDGLDRIANDLRIALGETGRSEATKRIAAQMQNFLASDVVYTQRFVRGLLRTLEDEDLVDDVPVPEGLQRPPKGFLPDIDWLRPITVADRISRIRGGSGRAAAPGLHGTGLGTVTVKPGGQALTPGNAVDLKASENLSFDVQLQNQGENEEQDVTVKISIKGAGDPIELEDRLDTIAAGESKTLSIPLAETPPISRPVTIDVEIEPVPGEEKTDNNRNSFPAIFTR